MILNKNQGFDEFYIYRNIQKTQTKPCKCNFKAKSALPATRGHRKTPTMSKIAINSQKKSILLGIVCNCKSLCPMNFTNIGNSSKLCQFYISLNETVDVKIREKAYNGKLTQIHLPSKTSL